MPIELVMLSNHLILYHLLLILPSLFAIIRIFSNNGLEHTKSPCPSPTPGGCSNSCPLRWWCHPTISSSVTPFISHLQSFPALEFFPMSQFFLSDGQSIGVSASASVLPMNIQGWFPLGLTGLISLLSKRLSRVFSNTTVEKHQFFGTQPLWFNMTAGKTIALTIQTFVGSDVFAF